MIRLELPWPPSLNRYWRSTSKGVLLSAKGRAYREAIAEVMWHHGRPSLGDVDLRADLWMFPPDLRRRDTDNHLKAIFDSLEAANLYDNDCQIRWINARRCQKRKGGEVIARFSPITDEELESGSV